MSQSAAYPDSREAVTQHALPTAHIRRINDLRTARRTYDSSYAALLPLYAIRIRGSSAAYIRLGCSKTISREGSLSFLSIDTAAEVLVREWQKLYARSPRITVASTIVVSVAAGAIAFFAEQRSSEQREAKRIQNMSYSMQAQKLEETKSNLNALLQFVEEERNSLAASEQALRSLKKEHEQLKPLVESDRRTIDALFAAQEARNQAAQSTERWIGFAMGIGSSLAASFLWAVVSYVRRRSQATA